MKYLVILTKSYAVAGWLAQSFKPGKDGVTCVNYGGTNGSEDLVPPTYCGRGVLLLRGDLRRIRRRRAVPARYRVRLRQ